MEECVGYDERTKAFKCAVIQGLEGMKKTADCLLRGLIWINARDNGTSMFCLGLDGATRTTLPVHKPKRT